jgi:uncharacterized protein (TIGR02996 family)
MEMTAHDPILSKPPLVAEVCDMLDAGVPDLVLADWFGEHGDPAREEYVRVTMEMNDQRNPARQPQASEENDRRQDWLTTRRAAILRENPSWTSVPCPECKDERFPGYHGSDSLADAFSIELDERRCISCVGTGDLMFVDSGSVENIWHRRLYTFHGEHESIPLLRSVTLPTLADVMMECRSCRGRGTVHDGRGFIVCAACRIRDQGTGHTAHSPGVVPSPIARSLVAAVPTLRGIGVAELRPRKRTGYKEPGWAWWNCTTYPHTEGGVSNHLPEWLWNAVKLPICGGNKIAPTEAAANWAMESTIYKMCGLQEVQRGSRT